MKGKQLLSLISTFREKAHFIISLMHSRSILSDSLSMLVYDMNGPKLTAHQRMVDCGTLGSSLPAV
jgi:hypothetical protein